MKLYDSGVYLVNGHDIVEEGSMNQPVSREEAARNTMAYGILEAHNTSGNMEKLQIKFDKLTSHDITFVGIIQTARASGLEKFPVPYVLTNCHNSLCAVGGTINEDDHMFGLTCAKKYGGVYVPPHQAVIHQFAREMLAGGGKMILGSDSHTRYGALGTMAMGEGGGELVKQLLSHFRIGVDVMTTETTCLSSIWQTDEKIEEFYEIHGRKEDYKELKPGKVAYYDGCVEVDLSEIKPMIAMPFHPSNTYTIDELKANLYDILDDVEKKAQISLDGKVPYTLKDKVIDGKLYVEQGIIAGCAGGGFENICAAADILRGASIGSDAFTLSVYPASTPIYMELARNGVLADLLATGAVVKTAFCGPCFGAGDTPANNAFSIRHTTRNFPNREGSKVQNGQISSVALMDARSIAATAANKGFLTSAEEFDGNYTHQKYFFDKTIYENRIFDSKGVADPSVEIQFGPNIKDWPKMPALADNLVLKVVSEIHDPVTTTDELIPSGETSSFRSNPLGLAEFTLSRKDPAYVGRAKEIQKAQKALEAGECPAEAVPELKPVMEAIKKQFADISKENIGIGSTIFAVKPGDGSAREQAASCQKVLGGWANIANGDYLFFPEVRGAVADKADSITGYVVKEDGLKEFQVTLGELTDDEREIILKGCLINYNRG